MNGDIVMIIDCWIIINHSESFSKIFTISSLSKEKLVWIGGNVCSAASVCLLFFENWEGLQSFRSQPQNQIGVRYISVSQMGSWHSKSRSLYTMRETKLTSVSQMEPRYGPLSSTLSEAQNRKVYLLKC